MGRCVLGRPTTTTAGSISTQTYLLMTFPQLPANHLASIITQQYRHRKAIELHEKAIAHHKEAATLYYCGESKQADGQAQVAYGHAVSALEAGAQALKA